MPGDSYSADPYVQALGERFREARKKHGVNGAGAALLMGMTPQRLQAMEKGRIEPKAKDVALVARLTGADPTWLLYGDDPANREPIEVPDDPAYYRTMGPGRSPSTTRRLKRQPRARNQPTDKPLWRPEAWR